MKKSLIFAGAIFLTSGLAIAKTIDFDTSIKWNSNVVERALNKSGFSYSNQDEESGRDSHYNVIEKTSNLLEEYSTHYSEYVNIKLELSVLIIKLKIRYARICFLEALTLNIVKNIFIDK